MGGKEYVGRGSWEEVGEPLCSFFLFFREWIVKLLITILLTAIKNKVPLFDNNNSVFE